MELSSNIRCIPVDIGWSDIGSFTALAEVFPGDHNRNVTRETGTFFFVLMLLRLIFLFRFS